LFIIPAGSSLSPGRIAIEVDLPNGVALLRVNRP
jgi:hypothetical protein